MKMFETLKNNRKLIRLFYKLSGKQYIHFLHIGKTGGTSINHALAPYYKTDKYILVLHSHNVKLAHIPEGDKVVFFLREPISRFVSGFYSRKRKGYPRYFLEWTLEEQLTYLSFPNANDLALALSSENEKEKALALLAMKYVQHIRSSYWDWFGDQQYFLSRLQDIFYIGFQETLSDDFEVIKKKLALPKDLNLPTDPIQSHKNPDHFDKKLSATGIENLRKWYAKDIEFFEFCKSIALKTNNHE